MNKSRRRNRALFLLRMGFVVPCKKDETLGNTGDELNGSKAGRDTLNHMEPHSSLSIILKKTGSGAVIELSGSQLNNLFFFLAPLFVPLLWAFGSPWFIFSVVLFFPGLKTCV